MITVNKCPSLWHFKAFHIKSFPYTKKLLNVIGPDQPENGHLTVKKLPKFFIFFKKIAIGNFFEKNVNFWQFVFDSQIAIFWRVRSQLSDISKCSVIIVIHIHSRSFDIPKCYLVFHCSN